jgi:hypothetical protein
MTRFSGSQVLGFSGWFGGSQVRGFKNLPANLSTRAPENHQRN